MNLEIYTKNFIENKIFTFQGKQVMLDRDLVELYQVEVKRLNEQVKRNIERFPAHFRFQLSDIEKNELVANCDRYAVLKHSSSNPYVFIKQGIELTSEKFDTVNETVNDTVNLIKNITKITLDELVVKLNKKEVQMNLFKINLILSLS